MSRRWILKCILSLALLSPVAATAGEEYRDYRPGLLTSDVAKQGAVLLDFSATWCSTCMIQESVMNHLRAGNAAYDENIRFVRVDWDSYKDAPIRTDWQIPRRSTLLLLRDGAELGRVVAATGTKAIKALLDKAL